MSERHCEQLEHLQPQHIVFPALLHDREGSEGIRGGCWTSLATDAARPRYEDVWMPYDMCGHKSHSSRSLEDERLQRLKKALYCKGFIEGPPAS
jgi:hypothetical protein